MLEVGLLGASSELDSRLLSTFDTLHTEFHRKMWYHQKLYLKFKRLNAIFNALALLCIAAGIVISSVYGEGVVMVVLTAFSTLIKGWMDFKKLPVKMDMCRFAYTSYEKLLIEIQAYVRGMSMDDVRAFLVKCQVNEEVVSDLTPPVPTTLIREYDTVYHHVPVDKREATCHSPLIRHHAQDETTPKDRQKDSQKDSQA